MSKLITSTLLLVAAGMMSSAVQATDLDINGIIVASACTVDSASVNQNVDFGQMRATDLKVAGSAGDWKSFAVKLTHCPASTSKATVTFTGTPSVDDATLYANSSAAAAAQNVAVQMVQDADRSVVQGNGSKMTANVDAQHSAIYNLAARLYSVQGNAVAGTFTSVVLLNFTYQ
ncbi:fimbrial protein [Serratia quinivorans]|uniref:fimbrial protein n=1 Tax=Serratia quinivorans TaxID=137545 RepID=UPI003F9D24C0